MKLDTMHHIAIIGSDYEKSKKFYRGYLWGLKLFGKITGKTGKIIKLTFVKEI